MKKSQGLIVIGAAFLLIFGIKSLHHGTKKTAEPPSAAATQKIVKPLAQTKPLHWMPPKTYTSWAVTTGATNIRSEPDINSPVVLQTTHKAWFPILSHQGKWDKISLGTKEFAWVADWVVQKKQTKPQNQTVTVSNNTPESTGPDADFPVASHVLSSTPVIPVDLQGTWLECISQLTAQTEWIPIQHIATWGYGMVQQPASIPSQASVSPQTTNPTRVLRGKTIVVDPGHGGKDPGSIAVSPPVTERDINLSVGLALENKLQAAGARVIMTRTQNNQTVSLQHRADLSNENHADAFVSIHQNMFRQDPSINGTNTYYYEADTSKVLAQDIEKEALEALKPLDPNPERTRVVQEELYVLHHNNRPSVLIEGCFLSNPDSLNKSIHPAYHDALASGIFHGLIDYFQQHQRQKK